MTVRQVTFTEYALLRMHQRDILREEVLHVLAGRSAHRRRGDRRYEAQRRIPARGTLLVVYTRDADGVTVINAMWE